MRLLRVYTTRQANLICLLKVGVAKIWNFMKLASNTRYKHCLLSSTIDNILKIVQNINISSWKFIAAVNLGLNIHGMINIALKMNWRTSNSLIVLQLYILTLPRPIHFSIITRLVHWCFWILTFKIKSITRRNISLEKNGYIIYFSR